MNYKKRFLGIYFRVRLGHVLGRALRLGQARGPSDAAKTSKGVERRG